MGRNDLCFCGSGEKVKKCHENINSESVVARLVKVNTQIDKCIKDYYKYRERKPPCGKGCVNCCYDYFEISSPEYALILTHILKWDKKEIQELTQRIQKNTEEFKKDEPEMFKELEKRKNKSSDNKYSPSKSTTTFPCPFLHPIKNICMIYNNRPIVCRIHGSIFKVVDSTHYDNWVTCDYIGKRIDNRIWQPDVKILDDIEIFKIKTKVPIQERFKITEFDNTDKVIYEKGFPIFYALNRDLSEEDNIYNIINRYKHLIGMSELEYKTWYYNYLK